MKLDCEVIRDLLPLYAEHMASPASTALVEEHLQECEACRAELEQMQLPVPVQPEPQPDAPLKGIRTALRKKRILTAAAAVLAVLCAVVLVFWMGNLSTPVTAEEAGIWPSGVSRKFRQRSSVVFPLPDDPMIEPRRSHPQARCFPLHPLRPLLPRRRFAPSGSAFWNGSIPISAVNPLSVPMPPPSCRTLPPLGQTPFLPMCGLLEMPCTPAGILRSF